MYDELDTDEELEINESPKLTWSNVTFDNGPQTINSDDDSDLGGGGGGSGGKELHKVAGRNNVERQRFLSRNLHNIFNMPECDIKEPLLTDYQVQAIEAIFNVDFTQQRGLYYVMPPGFGKSYIIAGIMAMYMRLNYNVVCMSVARLDNVLVRIFQRFKWFDKEKLCLLHHRTDKWSSKLETWLTQRRTQLFKTVFLIDEAHLLNSLHIYEKRLSKLTQPCFTILDFILNLGDAHLYLFSGTPVINSLVELSIVNILTMRKTLETLEPPIPFITQEFQEQFGPPIHTNLARLVEVLRPYMIYVNKNDILPKLLDPIITEINFGPEELSRYSQGYNFYREVHKENYLQAQTVNEIGDHKIGHLIKLLKINTKPSIVYCNHIEKLANIIVEPLREACIKFAILNSQRIATWEHDMALFNSAENREGQQLQVIFYGPAGQVGISFENAQTVYLMAPPASYFNFIQITSRALRKNSLQHLTGKARAVQPVILVSVFNPDDVPIIPKGSGRIVMTLDQGYEQYLLGAGRHLYERMELILESLNILKKNNITGAARFDDDNPNINNIGILEIASFM